MHYAVVPHLLSTTKALDGSFPIGALLTREQFAQVMTPDTHGTTYGGNPLSVLSAIEYWS